MKLEKLSLKISLFALIFIFAQCNDDSFIDEVLVADDTAVEMSSKGKPDNTGDTGFGNNLSFPVIWADGDTKVLRGDMTQPPVMDGSWYYVWGQDPIDPQAPLFSEGPYTNENPPVPVPGDEGGPVFKSYEQKDQFNQWQATNWSATAPVVVDLIDWGDNLESVDWYTKSQVRTEIVLIKDLLSTTNPTPNLPGTVTQYAMRHAYGWGITEVHGLQTDLDDNLILNGDIFDATGDPKVLGTEATVYSSQAILTIQKLNVDKPAEGEFLNLDWDADEHYWVEKGQNPDDLINDPLEGFPMKVGGGDGPGYYNAEVNVKGKIIYGYTWNVRTLNELEGYYRITFSFDYDHSAVPRQTVFKEDFTKILVAEEEPEEPEVSAKAPGEDSGEDSGGGTGVIDYVNNLTYMDVFIKARGTGQGGGNSGGGVGGGGGIDGNHGGGTGTSGSGSGSGGSGSGSGGSGGGAGSGGSGGAGGGHNQ